MAGRKNYWDERIKDRLEEIAQWARDGYTEKQMCDALLISVDTFAKYKKEKSELVGALKINKEIADLTVENSLFKRANGYEYTETIIESYGIPTGQIKQDGTPEIKYERVHTKKIKKHVPPDTTAQIYWLKNRQQEKWRDRKNVEITGTDGQPMQFIYEVVNAGENKKEG